MSLGKLVFTKIRFIGFVCILVSFQAVNHRLVLCQEKKNRALVTFPPLQIAWDEHTLKQELRRARITASLLAGKTLHFSDLDGLAPRLRVIRQRLEQHLISRQFRKSTPTIAQLERQLNQIEARFKRRIQNQDTVPKRGFEERVAPTLNNSNAKRAMSSTVWQTNGDENNSRTSSRSAVAPKPIGSIG